MNEQNFDKSKQQEPRDLEERLTAYYGPQLREQPLSQTSWQNVRLRLGTQESPEPGRSFHWRFPRKRSRAYVPASIQDTFARIAYQARVPSRPSMLRFTRKPRVSEPTVRSSWLGRRKIRLILPLNAVATLAPPTLGRLLLASVVLVASLVIILSWIHHVAFVGIPLAITLYALVTWLLHLQARSIAFYADTLIVLWLGREHVCNGLHALSDRSPSPQRRRWGEPSLAERIERVCGTRVEARENQLTLVG
jgi:hypothetical protein